MQFISVGAVPKHLNCVTCEPVSHSVDETRAQVSSYLLLHTHLLTKLLSPSLLIQGVPGVRVTTSGFNSRADSESKMSYTHGPNSLPFRR